MRAEKIVPWVLLVLVLALVAYLWWTSQSAPVGSTQNVDPLVSGGLPVGQDVPATVPTTNNIIPNAPMISTVFRQLIGAPTPPPGAPPAYGVPVSSLQLRQATGGGKLTSSARSTTNGLGLNANATLNGKVTFVAGQDLSGTEPFGY